MEIYISKITFEDAGNSGGGGGNATPCYITEELQGYSQKQLDMIYNPIIDNINYTNQLTLEWDATNTSAKDVYSGNTQMVYAPAIDTSNVTNMYGMFGGCSNLEYVPYYNITSKVTDMRRLFNYCSKLRKIENIENWDVSNVTQTQYMFNRCGVTSLDLSSWNVSKVYNIGNMFYGCNNLTTLNLSGWNLSKVTQTYNATQAFYNCPKLTEIILDGATLPNIDNVTYGFDYYLTNLSVESLVGLLNALPVAGGAYTFKLGATNLNKLNDEQKAIATNKGWTLV